MAQMPISDLEEMSSNCKYCII